MLFVTICQSFVHSDFQEMENVFSLLSALLYMCSMMNRDVDRILKFTTIPISPEIAQMMIMSESIEGFFYCGDLRCSDMLFITRFMTECESVLI